MSCENPQIEYKPQYGYFLKEGKIDFRIYAPNADSVILVIFQNYDDDDGEEYIMEKLHSGDWEISIKGLKEK